ncbi:P2Y purinoceptor 13-like [Engraulis encrasicolus]|uniref:P2Y purinoceptor 13-like n=1 Tax=Engraulis encrasicolus TaxID=184585 RepID=UPI002FCFA07A
MPTDMMNTTEENNRPDCGKIDKAAIALALPSLYFLIFVPAFLLNTSVAWILFRLKTDSNFMVYMKNLVVADLLMTLLVPIKATSELPHANLGLKAFACQFGSVTLYACLYISMVLMGLISLDRYFKIVRPCGSTPCQSLAFGWTMSALTWAVLVGQAVPTMVLSSQDALDKTPEVCMGMKSKQGKDYHKAIVRAMNMLFLVILALVGFCYTCIARTVVQSFRNSGSKNVARKRKTKAKVFVVLAVFLICYAPYHIIRIPYTELQVKNKDSCPREYMKVVKEFGLWLACTNICLDPLIYFFLCRGFREKLLNFGIIRIMRSSNTGSGTEEELSMD